MMIISAKKCKHDTYFYQLSDNAEDSIKVDVGSVSVTEQLTYTHTCSVLVKLRKIAMPVRAFENVKVSGETTLDNGVSFVTKILTKTDELKEVSDWTIEVFFAYGLVVDKGRNEAGQQLIRNTVSKAFKEVDFERIAIDEVLRLLAKSVETLNAEQEASVRTFFDNNAAELAEKLIGKYGESENWDFLLEQERQVKLMLEDIRQRKASIRKKMLITEFKQDDRPFSSNIEAIVDQRLFNSNGI